MEIYDALCGWFLSDEDVTITPDIVDRGDRRARRRCASGFGDVKLPADQIVAARAYVLVLAILGQLAATNNWFRIAREVIFGEPPVTELGRAEAEHLSVSGAN